MILYPDVTELQEKLRRQFGLSGANAGLPAPLRKILMVGATVDYQGYLYPADAGYLRWTIKELSALKIPVAGDFQVAVANINPMYGGADFLDADYAAHIGIACCVMNPAPLRVGVTAAQHAAQYGYSPKHWEPAAWRRAAEQCGIKVISAFQVSAEIGPEHFTGGAYQQLRSSSDFCAILATEEYTPR